MKWSTTLWSGWLNALDQQLFGQGKAMPLVMPRPARAGGWPRQGDAHSGWTGGFGCSWRRPARFVHRQRRPVEVQQRVNQHGAVTLLSTKRSRSAQCGLACA